PQQFQQFQTATISANNAKFPYLEKEKYNIWAMKMEYWIQNPDHNLWRIVQQGNSPKRLGKDAKGNPIVHPLVSLDEYAAASCCAQVLWIQNQLLDYGFNFMNTKIFIDNQSTICIVKNPVFHQRTKHIEIRHHFIRDANEKNLIQVLKIHTDDNVADLLIGSETR
ncbi:hypothetical protein Tco_0202927, partial [Tanacetum coccineum]